MDNLIDEEIPKMNLPQEWSECRETFIDLLSDYANPKGEYLIDQELATNLFAARATTESQMLELEKYRRSCREQEIALNTLLSTVENLKEVLATTSNETTKNLSETCTKRVRESKTLNLANALHLKNSNAKLEINDRLLKRVKGRNERLKELNETLTMENEQLEMDLASLTQSALPSSAAPIIKPNNKRPTSSPELQPRRSKVKQEKFELIDHLKNPSIPVSATSVLDNKNLITNKDMNKTFLTRNIEKTDTNRTKYSTGTSRPTVSDKSKNRFTPTKQHPESAYYMTHQEEAQIVEEWKQNLINTGWYPPSSYNGTSCDAARMDLKHLLSARTDFHKYAKEFKPDREGIIKFDNAPRHLRTHSRLNIPIETYSIREHRDNPSHTKRCVSLFPYYMRLLKDNPLFKQSPQHLNNNTGNSPNNPRINPNDAHNAPNDYRNASDNAREIDNQKRTHALRKVFRKKEHIKPMNLGRMCDVVDNLVEERRKTRDAPIPGESSGDESYTEKIQEFDGLMAHNTLDHISELMDTLDEIKTQQFSTKYLKKRAEVIKQAEIDRINNRPTPHYLDSVSKTPWEPDSGQAPVMYNQHMVFEINERIRKLREDNTEKIVTGYEQHNRNGSREQGTR